MPVEDLEEDTGGGVRSVVRSLAILEHLAASQPARVGAIAPAVGLSKSTTQRALKTLERAGWVRQEAGDASWEVAPRVRTLFGPSAATADLRRVAQPVLEQLRAVTGETVHLTVPIGDRRVEIADRLDTAHELRTVLPIGTVFDAAEVAGGIALRPERYCLSRSARERRRVRHGRRRHLRAVEVVPVRCGLRRSRRRGSGRSMGA